MPQNLNILNTTRLDDSTLKPDSAKTIPVRADSQNFKERRLTQILDQFAAHFASALQKALGKIHKDLRAQNNEAGIQYVSLSALLLNMVDWAKEDEELKNLELLAATFKEMSLPQSEFLRTISDTETSEAKTVLKEVLRENTDLLDLLADLVEDQKKIDKMPEDDREGSSCKKTLMEKNQALAKFFYQSLQSEKYSTKRRTIDTIFRFILEFNNLNNTADAELSMRFLNGARAHAGIMFFLIEQGFTVFSPETAQLLEWETNGIDLVAVKDGVIYLIDAKGRSKTEYTDRAGSSILHTRASAEVLLEQTSQKQMQIGRQLQKNLPGNPGTPFQIKAFIVTIPTDKILLGPSGEIDETIKQDIIKKLTT